MATKDVYIAVYATFEDGQITGFSMDTEGPVGSNDGHIYNHDTEDWEDEEEGVHSTAYRRLSSALEELNTAIAWINGKEA